MPRRFWTTLFPRVLAGLCLLAAFEGIATAHQSPALCNANNIDVVVTKDKTSIVDPDTVTYTVSVVNGGAGACDVTDATVSFRCPAADGTPTGTLTTFTTTGSFPADGSGDTTYAPVACFVDVNPGVVVAVARGSLSGTLHDSPLNTGVTLNKDLGVDVSQPTPTPTNTNTPTNTPTRTNTPTNTPTNVPTNTPTNTPSNTPTFTPPQAPPPPVVPTLSFPMMALLGLMLAGAGLFLARRQ